jgi:uncharacterized membrane protein YdjX (TVP38/TMEM64 family)
MSTVPLLISSTVTILAIRFESEISSFGLGEWILFFGISVISMAFALTPTTFIALFCGYFLGLKAIPYMLIAYLAASWLGYNISKLIDKGVFFESLEGFPKAKKFVNGMHERQLGIIILSRISPVLPFAIMNVILSIIGVRIKPFLFAGFVGMLPRTILFMWVGRSGRTLRELLEDGIDRNNFLHLITIVLVLVSILGMIYYIKVIFKKNLKE